MAAPLQFELDINGVHRYLLSNTAGNEVDALLFCEDNYPYDVCSLESGEEEIAVMSKLLEISGLYSHFLSRKNEYKINISDAATKVAPLC